MSLASPYPPVQIPEVSLYGAIFANLTEEDCQRPAITDSATGQTMTYGELRDAIDAFAGEIAHRGIEPHDVIALHCPNTLAFAIAFHGALHAGATVTTVNVLATKKDIVNQLQDSEAKMFFTVSALGTNGVDAAVEVGIDKANIIHLDSAEGLPAFITSKHTAPDYYFDPVKHLAALPYSSGTTGRPKGVRLSHRNLLSNTYQIEPLLNAIDVDSNDTVMAVLPFFHVYGMNALLNVTLYLKAHLITMPKFDLVQFLELHVKHKITFTFIAPPIAVALAKHPIVANYDLSHLRTLLSGAAKLDAELARAVQDRLDVRVVQGFGMTETSPVTHLRVDDALPLDSVGPPVANTEQMIVDTETLQEIPLPAEGEISPEGELWVRGPQIMVGYLRNQEADAKTITPAGWLRTGDICNMDSDGNVFVIDRMKELIKYKGYQVAPAELESLLLTHPDVADSAVVGFYREDDGEEVPRAFVVAQEGKTIEPDELMEWVAERVAPYKKIRIVDIIDAIPKSSTGKILRKDLREIPRQS